MRSAKVWGGTGRGCAACASGRPRAAARPTPGEEARSPVPFRNAHLLAAGVSWAEVLGARRLFVGAVCEDSSGYPDCRPEFYRAFEEAARLGTRSETELEIVTPVIGLRKAEIVKQGLALGAPFELTWSCYEAEVEACGTCESCFLRQRAFADAGVPDPARYHGPPKA